MGKLVYDQSIGTWRKISKNKIPVPIQNDLPYFRKMLDIFQVGEYFYVIYNVLEGSIEYCDNQIIDVLGIKPESFTSELFFSIIHPDDLPVVLDYEETVAGFFNELPPERIQNYKTRYDFRLRSKQGQYKRFLHQVAPIQTDSNGKVLRTLAVYTDIGFLKNDTSITLSVLGLNGEPSYMELKRTRAISVLKNPLSKREVEVLRMIALGKSSKQIADTLFLSEHTVKNHRKNCLRKTGMRSTNGLLTMAHKHNWV